MRVRRQRRVKGRRSGLRSANQLLNVIETRALTGQGAIALTRAPHPPHFLLRSKPFFRDLAFDARILGRPPVQSYQQEGYRYNNRRQAPPEQRTLLSRRASAPVSASSILQMR
jgi:hypothetical protein